jgi:hypothetical protein
MRTRIPRAAKTSSTCSIHDAFANASRDKHNGVSLSLVLVVAVAETCAATVELRLEVASHSDVHREAIVLVIRERRCNCRDNLLLVAQLVVVVREEVRQAVLESTILGGREAAAEEAWGQPQGACATSKTKLAGVPVDGGGIM